MLLSVPLLLVAAACQQASVETGRFATRLLASAEGQSFPLLVDLNRDGALDLVEAQQSHARIVVRLGDGQGSFADPVAHDSGPFPNWLRSADMDLDGHLDLVTPNHEQDRITLLKGDGEGGFAPAEQIALPPSLAPHPHVVEVADMDGDGRPDLVVDSREEMRLYILYNRPGEWQTAPVEVGGDPYLAFAIADFDGDGLLDIASPHSDHVAIVRQRNGGDFVVDRRIAAPGPFAVLADDMDGDGRAELVIASQTAGANLTILDDDLETVIQQWERPAGPKALATGDMDGDGSSDLVLVQWNGLVWLASGPLGSMEGRPLDTSGMAATWGAATGDIDGDGNAELVLFDGEGSNARIYDRR
ncbi:FG-GAP repeat domain-containing protein [Sphingomicrobium lutaoense]|uniref:VCBS repeat-containing protein n=1 Tax=Sphingomicrobium lutaoense TaxID=515949 RepID=A0A839Z4G2_9SPHN|nr:VCBS repeat-containing protein [Sphingomicrobium lutaoense]MBB3764743.1 hypothetical protein [Sphingomicrobium lutaoense]